MSAMMFATQARDARPLFLFRSEDVPKGLSTLDPSQRAWAEAAGFKGKAGQVALLPGEGGEVVAALGGLGGAKDRARSRFVVAGLRSKLPDGAWVFKTDLVGPMLEEAALAWQTRIPPQTMCRSSSTSTAPWCAPTPPPSRPSA